MQRVLRTMVVGAAVALGGTLAAACGSSSANSPGGATSAPAAQSAGAVAVKTAHTSLGTVLTTSAGMTIYHLTSDPMDGTACTGSCAALWPPVMVSSASSIGPGMSGFGTIQRPGGGLQATYHGEALYTYKGDTAPGQTNGQGLPQQPKGTWFAVTLSSASSSGSTTTTAPSGGGGGSTSTTAGGGSWG